MKALNLTLFGVVCAIPALLLVGAGKTEKATGAERVSRGKYLVGFGGCNDCHTPLKLRVRCRT